VGKDDRTAWEEAEPALRILWRRFVAEGKIPRDRPEPERFNLENAPGQFLVGSAQTVTGFIQDLHARAPFDTFNIEPRWEGFTPEQVHASIRRFADGVMPAFPEEG
jgi:alkanesulfonate monooxygenase SsuD/methylene tetrahydromethanopterin reductase-like flavin-dependent oxidoreductase (luciferase family)